MNLLVNWEVVMRIDWKKYKLSELISLDIDCRGKTPPKVEKGIPTLTAGNIKCGTIDLTKVSYVTEEIFNEYSVKKGKPKEGDILITTEAPVGEVAMFPTDQKYLISRRVIALRPNIKIVDPDFLFFYLSSSLFQSEIYSKVRGSTVPRVLKEDIFSIELEIPEFNIQKKIGGILSSLNKKIYVNSNSNHTLEQIAQAIFHSWFVDFDPVKAKMKALRSGGSGEDATIAAMSIISGKSNDELSLIKSESPNEYKELKTTAELFPSSMQDSELGEIPNSWEVGLLSDIIDFNPRRVLKKGTFAPYLDMQNLPTQGHLANRVILREMGSGTKFINGDTLLARITPCLQNGKTAYVDFLKDDEVGWGSTEYIVMRPKDHISTSLGYFISRLDIFRTFAIQSMTGSSGRQRANTQALADLRWIIYPDEILEKFSKISDSVMTSARKRHNENKNMEDIRNNLLPRLLSGAISINNLMEISN